MFWSNMAERECELESSIKSSGNGVALKVILLGVSGVGKTSLFLRIIENKFYEDTSEKRVDSSTHHITVNGKTVQVRYLLKSIHPSIHNLRIIW
jgi:GTPase SAR1 family protein